MPILQLFGEADDIAESLGLAERLFGRGTYVIHHD